MSNSHLYIAAIIITIELCSAGKDKAERYVNLYGFSNDETPFNKLLGGVSFGLMKFMGETGDTMQAGKPDMTPSDNQEFDFIVVGAGSAGAALAARLSEVADVTVLLIEAGRNENTMMDIPILVNYLQFLDTVNWKYQTESSENYCVGMTEQKCNFPRGRVMGGSSVLNYMIATRGFLEDYDKWAEMGNEGWSYSEVLKYFRKLENVHIDEYRRSKLRGTRGPLAISYPPFHTPLAEGFINAGFELGYDFIDYNADKNIGFSYIQATMRNGTRMSTNRAYLFPAKKRKNLFVSKLSHVNRVLIDPVSKIAYGVEYSKANKTIQVRAKKEVILSAGAIGSPQILMLSGIGPAKHLEDLGINVIQDLPVGENLMDHIAYGGLIFLINQPVSLKISTMVNSLNSYMNDYFNNKTGPYAIPGGCEALAFIDVDKPADPDGTPKVELLFIGGSIISNPHFQKNFGISDEYWEKMYAELTSRHSWTIFPMLMKPKSRGQILLRNKNPESKPRIYANYMTHPDDVRIIIKGIRAAIEISKTESMQKFNSKLYNQPMYKCEKYKYGSDKYWECAARTFPFTIYHQSGTCKMAPENDETGVVNPRLQVKGIKNLRVGDASIMPEIIAGHTNVPTIMIAEKLADMVKEDWDLLPKGND
ncbi:glucose dehydrogenase [FAD, quinone] [Nasonia vitripennis]|uniref:Glucose-methanol-choline oxidoreductase N-terminal domain-containing protein n=1 Tax=Nasonia vitripennis TaxID=7425 RepID=A0A7M7ITJ0_NASVI|nr:glucose dehydrogenase [FAD, quinone] [Nasonia vitripennis]